jgi:transposase
MGMANPYPTELRERAVRAYEAGDESYAVVATRFSVNLWTLVRWVLRWRETGTIAPRPKAGGWQSPVNLVVLHAVVRETPDATTEELRRAYNRRVDRAQRVHRSSILRALQRSGYVFKKNARGPRNRIDPTCRPSATRSASGPRV